MTTFTREIKFVPGWDYRDNPDPKLRQRGAHGMEIYFILKGDLGAITGSIMTDWQSEPLVDPYPGIDRHDGSPLERIKHRAGVDGGHSRGPNGGPLSLHSPTQDNDWWAGPHRCDVLGGQCYSDSGFILGEDFKDVVIREGHEAAWKFMEDHYEAWLVRKQRDD